MAQEEGVDQAEDRRVGADPQGERERRDEGEDGAAAQRAGRVAQILGQLFDEARTPHLPAPLLDLRDPAEGAQSGLAGLARAHAGRDVFSGLLVDVEAQFGGELGLDAGAPEDRAQAQAKDVRSAHGGRPDSHHARDQVDGAGEPVPVGELSFELLAAGPGQRVDLGLAAGLGRPPRGGDPRLLLQAVESRVE